MFSNPHKLVTLALLGVILFAVGLIRLFFLRFEAGDIYPPYSSLRSDPLGAQALFESLNRVPESSAQRNFRTPEKMPLAPGTTALFCGLGENDRFMKRKVFEKVLDRLSDSGGRLVLTFAIISRYEGEKELSEEKGDATVPPSKTDDEIESKDSITDPLNEESKKEELPSDDGNDWRGMAELGVVLKPIKAALSEESATRTSHGPVMLPEEIPWRTPLAFQPLEEDWQTVYTWQDRPVVMTRTWGRGSLVLSADSYLFSNEALRNHRQSDLLSWFIVPGHDVIFDEFHHGLIRQPGIAALARKYRLHGVFAALIVVTLLFIWRQAAVFVPPPAMGEDPGSKPQAVGRDTAEGLVNLMRQHIGSADLLTTCFDAWHANVAHRVPEALVAKVRQRIHAAQADQSAHDPVQVYQHICKLLERGKHL